MRKLLIPKKIHPRSDDQYLEILAKTIFQVGFSWPVVEHKWPAFQRAFHRFRVSRVARMTDAEVDHLLKDPAIIRNGRKILAVIHNAQHIISLEKEHGSLQRYLRSLRRIPYAQRRKILAKQFASIGPTGVFVWLYTVSEPVPDWHARLD